MIMNAVAMTLVPHADVRKRPKLLGHRAAGPATGSPLAVFNVPFLTLRRLSTNRNGSETNGSATESSRRLRSDAVQDQCS